MAHNMHSKTSLTASVTQWWTWTLRVLPQFHASSKAKITTRSPLYKNKEIMKEEAFITPWKALRYLLNLKAIEFLTLFPPPIREVPIKHSMHMEIQKSNKGKLWITLLLTRRARPLIRYLPQRKLTSTYINCQIAIKLRLMRSKHIRA